MSVKNEMELTKILEIISTKTEFWAIGERSWTAKLQKKIIRADIEQSPFVGETGVFFILDPQLKQPKFFSDCMKIYFFNQHEQYACFRENEDSSVFTVYNSTIVRSEGSQLYEFENIHRMQSQSRNYRYCFADRIGAIPKDLTTNLIKVLTDITTKEWRFYHE